MEFQKRFDKQTIKPGDWEKLLDALAARDKDIEKEFNLSINQKHAPILVPRVTIDPAHKQKGLAPGSAVANWTALNWQNELSTTANTFQTAVNYVGRGILTRAVFAEITSAGSAIRVFGGRITIDGNVVYSDATACVVRESAWRVVVGTYSETGGTNHAILDAAIGLPFNNSCLIELVSDGTRTFTVGWHIDKKL